MGVLMPRKAILSVMLSFGLIFPAILGPVWAEETMSITYEEGQAPLTLTLERPRLLVKKSDMPALREKVKKKYAALKRF